MRGIDKELVIKGNYEELEGSIHQQEEEEDQQHMFNGEVCPTLTKL